MNKDIAELKDSIEFTDAKLIEKQKNIEKLKNKYKEIKNVNEILKKKSGHNEREVSRPGKPIKKE